MFNSYVQLWPALAEWFGVKVDPLLKTPLTKFMPEHEGTWSQIREKYHLKDLPYDKVCAWEGPVKRVILAARQTSRRPCVLT